MTVQTLVDRQIVRAVNAGDNMDRNNYPGILLRPAKHCYGAGAGRLRLGNGNGQFKYPGSSVFGRCGLRHSG